MRQILLFVKYYKDFFLFLFLFLLSLVLIVNANSFQRSRYFHSANIVSGGIYQITEAVVTYFDLKYQNELLVKENNQLRQQLLDVQQQKINQIPSTAQVSFSPMAYRVFRAEVIKNSINLSKNYLLLNKGEKDSIYQDMGVISSAGIVGIIDKTSGGFASVQSVLNIRSRLSVALKKTGHYGTLSWDGKKTDLVQLIEVPQIAPVQVGDTIVTDGRSSIFPKGIPVGRVADIQVNQIDNTWLLNVSLFTDMSNLQHVYIIKNKEQATIRELENEIQNQINND